MIVETKKEMKRLLKSGKAIRAALNAMTKAAKPGVSTWELNRIGVAALAEHGSEAAPPKVYNFPGDFCISINEEALHGIPSKTRILMAGDLLKLDIVADRQGYYTDAAVTLLIEPEQCSTTDFRLRECAFWAFHEALKAVKPGVPTNDIGRVVEGVAKDYKFSVMEGFGGHGVGKTIHESPFVPNHYMEECNKDILLEGMVITIEPIICELSGTPKTLDDGWTVTTVDGGRTAHYEHTLCLTKDGPVLVTQ